MKTATLAVRPMQVRGNGGRGTGRARMEDVARLAGVSAITVSRALRQPDKVSAATRARVEDAIREIGYVPNLVAGSLASSRSNIIAAIVPSISTSIFADTVQGMVDMLKGRGYELLLGNTGYSAAEEQALVAAFLGRQPDGMMLTGVLHTELTRQMLGGAGIPVVETWDLSERPIDLTVGFSNSAAADAMTRYLHSVGYRRIAYITGSMTSDKRSAERRRGYQQAMSDLGLPEGPVVAVDRPTAMHDGAHALTTLLGISPRVDAVFCSSDILAFGALMECRRRGVGVPDDIGIAGFGDFDVAAEAEPSLTTVSIPGYQIGRNAAEMLLERLDGREVEPKTRDLGFRIVPRRSTHAATRPAPAAMPGTAASGRRQPHRA